MKIRIAFLSLVATLTTMAVSAQVVEYDDMYFNSKDRVKVTSARPVTMTAEQKEMNQVVTPINPTDSYSARNVNPEYISQSKINPSAEVLSDAPYFTPDYTPTGVNQNIYNNSSIPTSYYNSVYNNPYYGMSSFGNPYGGYYPYGSAFSPYGYGSMYPSSGWSTMWNIGMSFGYGMMGNPSMGMGMGWGCGYCYNSFYGYGMSPWGYSNYYPGGLVVIGNPDNNARPVTYGRRTSRSSDLNNTVYNNNRATGNTTTTLVDANGKVRGAGGRNTSGNEPGSYYQSGWRENPATRPSSNWSNTNGNRSSTQSTWFENNSRSGGSRSGSDSFFNSGSRSSGMSSGSGFSSGGGSRSSGTSSGSSGVRRGRD
jgi:hypothetical protein